MPCAFASRTCVRGVKFLFGLALDAFLRTRMIAKSSNVTTPSPSVSTAAYMLSSCVLRSGDEDWSKGCEWTISTCERWACVSQAQRPARGAWPNSAPAPSSSPPQMGRGVGWGCSPLLASNLHRMGPSVTERYLSYLSPLGRSHPKPDPPSLLYTSWCPVAGT